VITPTVAVSKHAVSRYLERVKGVDPSRAQKADRASARVEIAEITGVAAALGARVKVHDGFVFIIADYTVTTVLPKGGIPAKRSMPSRELYPVAARGASR
jgi:hypothetical protein